MTLVYKICPIPLWRAAEETGSFAGAPVDLTDGFIHLSTAAQVAETVARHFVGQADLFLVTVDEAALGEALRYEPSRGGALFPHLYGPLPFAAVRRVEPLPLGPDGTPLIPDLAARSIEPAPPQAFDPAAAGWRRRAGREFMALVGPIWVRGEGAGAEFGFVVERRHLNTGGVVHGGMLMTFADQALGMAGWSATGNRPQVTIQLDTHFISGAKLGEFVEARCEIRRQARSLIFLAAELVVGDRLVATATGVWKLRDRAA